MSAVSVQNGLSTDLWRIVRADLKAAMLRPSIRIAVLIWILQIVIFAYGIPYVLYRSSIDGIGPETAEALRASLELPVLGEYVTASVPSMAFPLVLQ